MNNFLSINQIDYLLFHLNFVFDTSVVRRKMVFITDKKDIDKHVNSIIFILSPNDLNLEKIGNINQLPVLFPLSARKFFYRFENYCFYSFINIYLYFVLKKKILQLLFKHPLFR